MMFYFYGYIGNRMGLTQGMVSLWMLLRGACVERCFFFGLISPFSFLGPNLVCFCVPFLLVFVTSHSRMSLLLQSVYVYSAHSSKNFS